ncbi:MAG: TIGR04255 family protein [Promethearchaeota archaeon]
MSNNMDNIYEKSILHEVIFEARYPLKLNLKKNIGDFQELLQDLYPYVKKEIQQQFLINPEIGAKIVEPETIWRFSNDEQDEVSIFSSKITLKLSIYHSWEDHQSIKGFKSKILEVLHIFKQIWPIPRYDRIGLRYINKKEFPVPLSSSTFEELFIPIFNIEKYPVEDLVENQIRIRKNCPSESIITIQYVFQYNNPEKSQFCSFYLDFDSFIIKVQPDIFEEKLEILHVNIIEEFESLINDKLRKEMNIIGRT